MNIETLLYRQVHPAWVQDGRITSQAFRPTPKDERRLSVYDGELISAANAWAHYTTMLGLSSYGVMAVTLQDCDKLGLAVRSDPQPFPEHAVIDFVGLTENQIKSKAKHLKAVAESHGWQFLARNDA